MRKLASLGILGVSLFFSVVCSAQMSSFPSPPPLPPQHTATQPSQPSNSTSSLPPDTDPGTTSPGTTGGTTPDNPPTNTSGTPTTSGTVNVPNTAPITAATLTSMAALDDKVELRPGDRISFRVIEDRDDAIPRIVTDTGEVDFPYIGRIKVGGLTCREVANQLKKLLEVDYYKSATVIVGLDVIADQEKAPHDVAWVVGQVRQVGPQELLPLRPMTVSQIILKAGGFGDFADQRKVRIIHREALAAEGSGSHAPDPSATQDTQIIDVKAVYDGQSKLDPVVKPNDYIIVPKRLFNY